MIVVRRCMVGGRRAIAVVRDELGTSGPRGGR